MPGPQGARCGGYLARDVRRQPRRVDVRRDASDRPRQGDLAGPGRTQRRSRRRAARGRRDDRSFRRAHGEPVGPYPEPVSEQGAGAAPEPTVRLPVAVLAVLGSVVVALLVVALVVRLDASGLPSGPPRDPPPPPPAATRLGVADGRVKFQELTVDLPGSPYLCDGDFPRRPTGLRAARAVRGGRAQELRRQGARPGRRRAASLCSTTRSSCPATWRRRRPRCSTP